MTDDLPITPLVSAKRLTPEQRAARAGKKAEDEPPLKERKPRWWRRVDRLWIFLGLFCLGALTFCAMVLIANVLPAGRARAGRGESAPTVTATLQPVTPTSTADATPTTPTATQHTAESGIMNAAQTRALNIQAPSITPTPKNALEKIGEGWFSWTNDINSDTPNTIHLSKKTGYTAGTKVLACTTQRVAQNNSRIEDYAIGNPTSGQLRCWPAVLSDQFPDPLPKPILEGAVSYSLWDWACGMSGADCERHPLSEWIIYKEIEQ